MILLMSPFKAASYVPPAEDILETLQSSNRGLNTLEVDMHTTLYGDHYGGGITSIKEKLFIKKGGLVRSERYLPFGKDILIQNGRKSLAAPSSMNDRDLRIIDLVLPLLFFQQSLDNLLNILNFLGVDTGNTSLGRIGQEVSYIIGDTDGHKPGNRIWIERKRGLPLRVTGMATWQGERVTLRAEYADYILVKKGFWFPGRIEIYKDDTLWVESTITNTVVNVSLPENLFYIPQEPYDGLPLMNFITVKD